MKKPHLMQNGGDATSIVVAAICAEMLGLSFIGLDDDLYELGSDSQQAVLIGLRIEETLKVELPLEVLEGCASVRTISNWIEAERERRISASGLTGR